MSDRGRGGTFRRYGGTVGGRRGGCWRYVMKVVPDMPEGDASGTMALRFSVSNDTEWDYPALAPPEMRASETPFPFLRSSWKMRSFS